MRGLKTFPSGQWFMLAGPVTNCRFHRPSGYGEFKFYVTSRPLSGSVPSGSDKTDGGLALNMFHNSNVFYIVGTTVLNIYVWAEKLTEDDKLAGVIVDL